MVKRILLSVCLLAVHSIISAQDRPLVPGMKIHSSLRIRKAIYNLYAPADTSKSVLVIEGDNIVIDFNNATIRGSKGLSRPDEFTGIAILVKKSAHATIKNLNARGIGSLLWRGMLKTSHWIIVTSVIIIVSTSAVLL